MFYMELNQLGATSRRRNQSGKSLSCCEPMFSERRDLAASSPLQRREVFVIRETARPIADWPLQLPDLTAVLESFIQRVIHLVHQNSACCHIVAAQHSSICLSWWDGVRLFKSGGASLLIFCSPCQALSRHNG